MNAHSRVMSGTRRAYIVHNGVAHRVSLFSLVDWLCNRALMRGQYIARH